ncbi:type VII secretion AAA-ATPase EccA [Mycobacterium xenopi]|uniref:type VII secretion AAA-ATPase EccA n=1 Tax=Mycobacterium xenopi TaxID=1789 RepID=UPI000A149663|nr:type VII secretion AAA-ATPase EccA [Mycobacterium xenopi]SPX94851.1 ATPase central domain-containing protein [Mycobacterium xenopi]
MNGSDALDLFSSSCAALGAEVYGRRQVADKAAARRGFERLTAQYPDQCDGWRGLAASGVAGRDVIENAYRTISTCGELMSAADVAPDAVDFAFDTGMYIQLHAHGADGVILACAAARAAAGDYAQARDLLDERILAAQPAHAGWVLAVLHFRAKRWHDVRRVLAPLTTQVRDDTFLHHAVQVAYGLAGAYLGMWEQAFEQLSRHGQGPIAPANAEALLGAGLCARALGRAETATALLNEAYAVVGISENLRSTIATALGDPGFGIHPTTAARIDARNDYWDPNTEPGERDFARQLGAARREELKAEAAAELADFVGMVDVKEQISRLESSVRADKQREVLGLPVRNKSLHLVLKGPPGTGKTTVARVIGKLLCAADVLPSDTFVEVGRADLVDRYIGGSEANIKAIINRIIEDGGGVLFIDEAYALTDSVSDNDFGPKIIAELLTAMVNHSDKLMVIAAGYADKMQQFLDSNEGLRSRFTRAITLPSYSVDELVEISIRKAAKGGSVIADPQPLRQAFSDLAAATAVDSSGRQRRALDVLGNARFSENLIAFAEEERDHRLDVSGKLGADATVEDLQTITVEDLQTAVARELDRADKEQHIKLSRLQGDQGLGPAGAGLKLWHLPGDADTAGGAR